MSIATKKGDDGTTSLMYNRRVSKGDPRIEMLGFVDELNASLGQVRSQSGASKIANKIERVQKQLVGLMGELATDGGDRERYQKDGFQLVDKEFVAPIDRLVVELESRMSSFQGWAYPGDNPVSASLDVARCICRRAERQLCRLIESGSEPNREIQRYLNRLSDALWLLARYVESGKFLRKEKGNSL